MTEPTESPAPRKSMLREALSGAEHDYTTGSLSRAITLLAIPMVLEMAMESLFAVCDAFFVGRLGSEALATVGLTEAVLTLIYAVAFGLAMGTTATVARRIGEQDKPGAVTASTQAITLGLCVSAIVGIVGFLFATDILALMGATDATIETGGGYTKILLGTNVVIMLLFLNNAVFRGAGDAALAMRSLWLANGINIVLDPCLIFGLGPFPELGVTGAAVATTIGRGSGVMFQFWMLRRGTGRIRLHGAAFRFDWGAMSKLLRVSMGGIGQMLVATASWVVLMRLVAPYGADAVAGYTIAVRIIIFVLLPSWGISNAAATLVGQNLGADRPDRAEQAVWLTGFYNMLFLGTVAFVFIFTPEMWVGLFMEEPNATVIEVGADALRIISYGYALYAWGFVLVQAFNGAGDTATPTWINVWCFWALQIPLAWLLTKQLEIGPQGVFWSITVAECALALIAIVLFRRGKWKTKQV